MPKAQKQGQESKDRNNRLFYSAYPRSEWATIENDSFANTFQAECSDIEIDERLIVRLNKRINLNMGLVDVSVDEQMRRVIED